VRNTDAARLCQHDVDPVSEARLFHIAPCGERHRGQVNHRGAELRAGHRHRERQAAPASYRHVSPMLIGDAVTVSAYAQGSVLH
jgi:hypothetical protein